MTFKHTTYQYCVSITLYITYRKLFNTAYIVYVILGQQALNISSMYKIMFDYVQVHLSSADTAFPFVVKQAHELATCCCFQTFVGIFKERVFEYLKYFPHRFFYTNSPEHLSRYVSKFSVKSVLKIVKIMGLWTQNINSPSTISVRLIPRYSSTYQLVTFVKHKMFY